MDSRINSDREHGIPVFDLASAGASFPQPSTQLSQEAASLVLLLNRAKEQKKSVIMAFSGHYDCVMVNEIWRASAKLPGDLLPHEQTFLEPYRALIEDIRRIDGLEEYEQVRLLNVTKTLQDMNHALLHVDVRKAMQDKHLNVVAYMEDPGTHPHTLYVFDPLRMHFVATRTRLAELSVNERLLAGYTIQHAVDIRAFVALEAERMVYERYRYSAAAMVAGSPHAEAKLRIVQPR